VEFALDRGFAEGTEAGENAAARDSNLAALQGAVVDVAPGAGEDGLELFAVDSDILWFGGNGKGHGALLGVMRRER